MPRLECKRERSERKRDVAEENINLAPVEIDGASEKECGNKRGEEDAPAG
ncbi:MAG: hypothetical protein G01um101417_367 [Parcubacteria group bacterium Gr01-1014_17]|nr:MAG: hypothetical protein G01um101417_367 [Parcubacteria group bacterium Gr01-1014_17]